MSLQGVGEALYRAWGPVAQALGGRPPVPQSGGGRGPAAKCLGHSPPPPRPAFDFPRGIFAFSPLSPSAWATGPLSPKQLAAGWYFCKIFKPKGIFAI